MVTATSARCAQHSETPAVVACARCGTFLCGECVELRRDESYCRDCARRLDAPASAKAKLACALTTLSFPGMFLLGFVAPLRLPGFALGILALVLGIALALTERAKLARGELSPRTRPWLYAAAAGAVLSGGAVAFVLFVLVRTIAQLR